MTRTLLRHGLQVAAVTTMSRHDTDATAMLDFRSSPIGNELGSYTILRELRADKQARVCLARSAVEWHPNLVTLTFVAKAEVRLADALRVERHLVGFRHPNLIALVDLIQLHHEWVVVAEHVDGTSVGEQLRRGGGEGWEDLPHHESIADGIRSARRALDDVLNGTGQTIAESEASTVGTNLEDVLVGHDGVVRVSPLHVLLSGDRRADVAGPPSNGESSPPDLTFARFTPTHYTMGQGPVLLRLQSQEANVPPRADLAPGNVEHDEYSGDSSELHWSPYPVPAVWTAGTQLRNRLRASRGRSRGRLPLHERQMLPTVTIPGRGRASRWRLRVAAAVLFLLLLSAWAMGYRIGKGEEARGTHGQSARSVINTPAPHAP